MPIVQELFWGEVASSCFVKGVLQLLALPEDCDSYLSMGKLSARAEGANAQRDLDVTFRAYDDEADKFQIIDMCKNVYGGTDRVPHSVSAYAEDERCRPCVLSSGSEIVAFCNVRLFDSDDDSQEVVYIECVRVLESRRGNGLATCIMREAMSLGVAWVGSAKNIRFLSTTVPYNPAMLRIFESLGWACRGVVEIWPSYGVLEELKSDDKPGPLLDSLGMASDIPQHAMESARHWKQVKSPSEVVEVMQCLRESGGSFLKPGYYNVATVAQASAFAETTGKNADILSAWKLERKHAPPVLLFIQKETVLLSELLPPQVLSACVVDIPGAECCIAFAHTRKDLDHFRIAFDPCITKERMKASSFLSQTETSTYMIYESMK